MKCGVVQSMKRRVKFGCLLVILLLILRFQFNSLFQVVVTWTEDQVTAPTLFTDPLNTRSTTLVHCVGENFLERSSWHFKSCHYRNLCHDDDDKDGQWTIHPSTMQLELEEDTKHLFLSTKLEQNVSSIGLRPAWVRTKQYQWSPQLIAEADDSKMATQPVRHVDSTIIIISVPPFESMLTFLVDTLFPIYNLIEIFHLSEQKTLGKKNRPIQVHVLNIDEVHDISWLEKGLSWMGYQLYFPNATRSSYSKVDSSSSSSRVCFSNAAAGIGMLTVTGLSNRGATKLRNHHARGSILYQFRNHLVRHTFETSFGTIIRSNKNEIQLALTRDHQSDLSKSLEAAFANKRQQGFSLHNVDWSSQSAENLMETAKRSRAWVAFANNDNCTWPALFLPHGAHLILLYDPKTVVKTKKKKNNAKAGRPIKLDFGLWNQLSHIRVHWLSLSHPTETLANIVSDILLDNDDNGSTSGIHRSNNTDDDETLSGRTFSSGSKEQQITFNGMPVRLKTDGRFSNPTTPSKVHCIGENWMWNAAHYRSCHVQNLCFDMDSKRFVLPTSSSSDLESRHTTSSTNVLLPMDSVSTWVDPQKTKVMMGHSIRHSTADDAWFPNIMAKPQQIRYGLDSKVVWLPIFTEQPNIHNPGHLMWDFWLPIYTLLELFSLGSESLPTLLLTNLDSSCTNGTKCYSMVSKFLPFLGVPKDSFLSQTESRLSVPSAEPVGRNTSLVVCAENALVGIGMLTDHGSKKHGQLLEDYQSVQNIGRGPMFWKFRNFMLQNLKRGKDSNDHSSSRPPWKITFSINSSQNPSRRRNMERQIEIARQLYPPGTNQLGIVVEAVQMDQLTLVAQTQLMEETVIFVSVMGGSASTAMFLKKDASLILYYNDIDDFAEGNRKNDHTMPNRMDWDFWNNASYLRVHWLPIQGMDDSEADLAIFAKLLQHEVTAGILAA